MEHDKQCLLVESSSPFIVAGLIGSWSPMPGRAALPLVCRLLGMSFLETPPSTGTSGSSGYHESPLSPYLLPRKDYLLRGVVGSVNESLGKTLPLCNLD